MSLPRPMVTCLIAKPQAHGNVSDIMLVTLEEAVARFAEGWAVVGPDPQTEAALNAWIKSVALPDGDDDGQ